MSLSVLICDPRHEYSRAFYGILEEQGIEIHKAYGGYDCLQAIRRHSPDVLLLSADSDFGFIDWALHLVRPILSRRAEPRVFLIGGELPQTLSDRWAIPVEDCLRRPLDEAAFAQRVAGIDVDAVEIPAGSTW